MRNLFGVIESSEMFLSANLAQGLASFIEHALTVGATRTLIDRVRRDPQDARRVLQRLVTIVAYRTDTRYANPNDVAISIYGLVLSAADADTFTVAAAAIANAPNCWWAPRVMQRIDPRRSETGIARTQPVDLGAVAVQSTASLDVQLHASLEQASTSFTAGVFFSGSTGGVALRGNPPEGVVADQVGRRLNTPTDSVLAPAA
jgi:hypothetical protein